MSRVLLADDSPHAQRMGEHILREEGLDVLSVADGDAALEQIPVFDPDILLCDAFLPKHSGFDICRQVKGNPQTRHVRVILTAGVLEPLDEAEASRAGSDAVLKKPFEATAMLETVKPLLDAARELRARTERPALDAGSAAPIEVSEEQVRAAVTLALDAAMPALVDEITRHVLVALKK